MLEISKTSIGKSSDGSRIYKTISLLVNGTKIDGVKVSRVGKSKKLKNKFHIEFNSNETLKLLEKYTVLDFLNKSIEYVVFDLDRIYYDAIRSEDVNINEIVFLPNTLKNNWHLNLYKSLNFEFNLSLQIIEVNPSHLDVLSYLQSSWNLPFTYTTYLFEFAKRIAERQNLDTTVLGQTFKFAIPSADYLLKDLIKQCRNLIKEVHDEVWGKLENSVTQGSVFREFYFPKHVQVACEQYLQFFVEFLRDLGIEATSNIKHNAGKVLFEVKPENKKVSLDKIRTALEVYLQKAKSPLIDSDNPNNGIREFKYIQEVNTLKTRLAQAEIQLQHEKQLLVKEKEIVSEKERVIQALSLFTKSVIEEKENSKSKPVEPNEKTKLLKGVVEIGGKIKIKEGIEIDVQRFLELTNLDSVFFELEEYLNTPLITELKLNEKSE